MLKSYYPIWTSSVGHLDLFSSITKKNQVWKTILGFSPMPRDFPYIRMALFKLPMVCFAVGELKVFERHMNFKFRNDKAFGNFKIGNLREDFSFETDFDSINIDEYIYPVPFMEAYNIPWIKISDVNNRQDHVLLSFSGHGMKVDQVTAINREIYQTLKIQMPYR